MNISELSIRRPVMASVLTIIILLFGFIGYSYLGVREYPSVDNPIISVTCSYPGANADVIENQITEPLEQNINGIPGIRSMSSVSSQGQSRITVEFELSVDLETAANDVRDKVSRAQRYLPRDCAPPTVTKADADATPILMVTIQSDKRSLLELSEIADLTGKPVGAFNIRKDSGCEARQSTEHIAIDPQPEGKSGIIIRIKDGTKGEQCHIPVIISKSGVTEMVYNDFYVGENCDVDIVAGCGIHNSGCNESRHDGVHTFYVSKNSHVRYVEKHYGEGDGEGSRVMNPTTIVYLDEGASIQMETVQIRGIDSTVRKTKIVCGKGAEAVITERLLTHGKQHAESDMEIELNGEDARGRVISRSVAQDESKQIFHPVVVGNSKCFGHVQCDSIIMGKATIESIPAITANSTDAQLIHEAAIGKIAGDQLLKLQTLGLTEEEAEDTILKGFLA